MADPLALDEPSELKNEVAFWEKVFGYYEPRDCILHDKDDLSVIYAVKKLPDSSPKEQARHVKHYLKLIKDAMHELAKKGSPTSRLEQRIWDVTSERLRHSAYWRYASENVRCQRGVDIGKSIERSKPYLRMVEGVLEDHGLPQDLAYLPLLESGYDRLARSRVGARGIWQLMPETARLNGLRVNRFNDQRIDPKNSTIAAAKLLKEFYERTKSWPLAITAYNYGINGTERAVKLYGANYLNVRDNHQSPIFGFAAKNYYPSFLAARNVAQSTKMLSRGDERSKRRFLR